MTADLEAVADFSFRVGEAIPHGKWVLHNLAEGEDMDGDRSSAAAECRRVRQEIEPIFAKYGDFVQRGREFFKI